MRSLQGLGPDLPADLVGTYERLATFAKPAPPANAPSRHANGEQRPPRHDGPQDDGILHRLVLRADGTCEVSEEIAPFHDNGLRRTWSEQTWTCVTRSGGVRSIVIAERPPGRTELTVRESTREVGLFAADDSLAYSKQR